MEEQREGKRENEEVQSDADKADWHHPRTLKISGRGMIAIYAQEYATITDPHKTLQSLWPPCETTWEMSLGQIVISRHPTHLREG